MSASHHSLHLKFDFFKLLNSVGMQYSNKARLLLGHSL